MSSVTSYRRLIDIKMTTSDYWEDSTQTEVLVPLNVSIVCKKAKIKVFKSIFKVLLNPLSNTSINKPPPVTPFGRYLHVSMNSEDF